MENPVQADPRRDPLDQALITRQKRGQGGSGLGMHIVYTIVHQMGGTVAAQPADPASPGCTIRMRLPLTQ
jgi:signal transduction histidine kinase